MKEFLERYETYLVLGHVEPDGDCVSSQIVLARFLSNRGKKALLLSAGPFDRPEILPFRELFRAEIRSEDRAGSAVAAVVVDCSTADRLGGLARAIRGLPVLVIDHHASGRHFGDVRWVRPQDPSVTYMIQHLLEAYPQRLPAEDAELLLFGLCTDTGFFRHLGEDSAPVFQAVARLAEAGASPLRVYRRIHAGWSPARVQLLSEALRRAERFLDGRVLLTYWSLSDIRQAGDAPARGSDELYRILQAVQGVEVAVFLREEAPQSFSVGLRSNSELDVGALAEALGGGGHTKAAGCTLSGPLEQVKNTLLAELARRLNTPAG